MATRLDTALGMAITQTNESRVLIPTVGVYSDKPSAVIPFLVTNDDNDSLMLDFINTVCIMKSARASIVIRDLGLEPPDSMRWAFSGYHEGFVATPIAWSDSETDQTEIMSIALGIISAPIGVSDGRCQPIDGWIDVEVRTDILPTKRQSRAQQNYGPPAKVRKFSFDAIAWLLRGIE